MIVTADPEKYIPMMKDYPICLPDAHPAIIDMIGLGAAPVEFEDQEILSLFEIFDGCSFNIITAIIELVGIVTQVIENLVQVLIDLLMQVGKMRAAVVITCVREIE